MRYPAFRRVQLLKLDVQGYELEVLKGADGLLSAAEVVLLEASLIPVNKGCPLIADVIRFMDESAIGSWIFVRKSAERTGHFGKPICCLLRLPPDSFLPLRWIRRTGKHMCTTTGGKAGPGTRIVCGRAISTANAVVTELAERCPSAPVPSRARLAILHFLSTQFLTIITMVVGLVSTPLLLHWLGAERFGLLRVLESWSSYLGIPAASMLVASSITLVPLFAKDDKARINSVLAATGYSLLLLAGLNLIIGLGMAAVLPWLVRAPAGLANECWWSFVLGLVSFWLVPLALVKTLFEAHQRGYRFNLSQMAQSLGFTGLALSAAWLGWGMPGQTLALLGAGIFQMALVVFWARRDYPWLAPWWLRRMDLRAVWLATSGLFALGAFATVTSRLEQICLNYFNGASGADRLPAHAKTLRHWDVSGAVHEQRCLGSAQ